MKVTTNGQSAIRIKMNEDITFAIQDDLIKTREKFLEYMGHIFDEAIYDSLSATGEDITEEEIDKCLTGGRRRRSKVMMIDEYSHIPNTVMMQMMEEGKEGYDTLREITEYVRNGGK